jgi:hypothetical protein
MYAKWTNKQTGSQLRVGIPPTDGIYVKGSKQI